MSTNNGRPTRRPRTTIHVPSGGPAGRETNGEPSEPVEGPQGILDGQATSAVTTVGNGRTSGGRFAEKNGFGRGNPNTKRQHELRQIFLEAISPDAVQALARKLSIDALKGDLDSAKLLLDHAIGRPAAAVELSGPQGEPLGLNLASITTVVLEALGGPEHAETRVAIAARLMELERGDAGNT